jgi:sugar phosphate isomerase/epimerase
MSDIFSVFTKPWKEPLPELADKLAGLGLGGVELPVRPGYQVTPENIRRDLGAAARTLGERGIRIGSIAGTVDEPMIAACGDAGVPIIRICMTIDPAASYAAQIDGYRRQFDAMVPLLDRFGVTAGVQNHSGNHIGSAIGVLHLIEKYEPKHVCAVLDMAHCGLDGEATAIAVDILKDRMHGLVNFKSAFRKRTNGPEDIAAYKVHWTTHQHSVYSWKELVANLKKIGFSGNYCLPAEYSDPSGEGPRMGDDVIPYLRQDLSYLKELLAN